MKDVALNTILKLPQWRYLAPLKRLRPLYQELMKPQYRIRKVGELKKNGGAIIQFYADGSILYGG